MDNRIEIAKVLSIHSKTMYVDLILENGARVLHFTQTHNPSADSYTGWAVIATGIHPSHKFVVWNVFDRPEKLYASNGYYAKDYDSAVDNYITRGGIL
jgi:hypothetical protein